MAGHTKKEIEPWFDQLMEVRDWSCLADASRDTKIPLRTIIKQATRGALKADAENILKLSDAYGVPVEVLLRAILGQVDLRHVLKRGTPRDTITSSTIKRGSQGSRLQTTGMTPYISKK